MRRYLSQTRFQSCVAKLEMFIFGISKVLDINQIKITAFQKLVKIAINHRNAILILEHKNKPMQSHTYICLYINTKY